MDTETNPVLPVAPESDETQSEQAVAAEVTNSPEIASDQEEKLYAGKFKSPEDMEKSYQELQSKFTKTAQEKAELERLAFSQQEPEQANADIPQLDPTVVPALDAWYQQRRSQELQAEENRKASEWAKKHETELQDKVLSGTVLRLMQEARENNEYLDRDDALAQAKELLDSRIKPQVKEAQIQAEKVGSSIAQKKAELGKIGETTSSQKINPDDLSADEYAKYFNIPRA